jgi:hypothetical protein
MLKMQNVESPNIKKVAQLNHIVAMVSVKEEKQKADLYNGSSQDS